MYGTNYSFWHLMLKRPITILSLLLMLVLAVSQARAQSTQGAIVGSIKDTAGAVGPQRDGDAHQYGRGRHPRRQVQ